MSERRGPIRWLFEDRDTGRFVVGQWPNPTMWVFLAALAASFVLPAGRFATLARVAMFVALAFWALDEATRGINPWRRLLGAGTLAGLFVWLVILKR